MGFHIMAKHNFEALMMAMLCIFAAAEAFNITKILNAHSDYSAYNDLLTQTKVADEINSRSSITVLVVPSGDVSELSGRNLSQTVVANVLRLHVLLQYFDTKSLEELTNGTTTTTTLYQTTGMATGDVGTMNITVRKSVHFGVQGTPIKNMATLVKEVDTISYNISVLEISSLVLPSAILSQTATPPRPSPPPVAPASPPAEAEAPADADNSTSTPSPEPTPTPKPKTKPKTPPKTPPVAAPAEESLPSLSPSDAPAHSSDSSSNSSLASPTPAWAAWPSFVAAALASASYLFML